MIAKRAALAAIALIVATGDAQAWHYRTIEHFKAKDGYHAESTLNLDGSGNLFGTASNGGAYGYGTVFRIANGVVKALHSFAGGSDGEFPYGGVIEDGQGSLYGTTPVGGAQDQGTVFTIARNGSETVLYSFSGGADGSGPLASLIADKSGNLYGTTLGGGTDCGCGTVFELKPDRTEKVLYAFKGGSDGDTPFGTLLRDGTGNLYGTTGYGGRSGCGGRGCGTVFKLAMDGIENVVYAFQGGTNDGAAPAAGLIMDKSGNLYGTTANGGNTVCSDRGQGCGTVFKVAADGTETILHFFERGNDGAYPQGSLITDGSNTFYGTTAYGGGSLDYGTVFKVTPNGKEAVIHHFKRLAFPVAALTPDSLGNLYGTAFSGTYAGGGGAFELTKR